MGTKTKLQIYLGTEETKEDRILSKETQPLRYLIRSSIDG